jgi:hypothetical protein
VLTRFVVRFFAIAIVLGFTAVGSNAYAQCNTAQVAQQNMQRQSSFGAFGGIAADALSNSGAGRQLRNFGIGRRELRQAGNALGVQLAGPLTRGLDECDQASLLGSTTQTLDTAEDSTWRNQQSGASGENRVVPTPVEVLRAHPGKDCRTVEQQLTLGDGGSRIQTVSACRNDAGEWETVGT